MLKILAIIAGFIFLIGIIGNTEAFASDKSVDIPKGTGVPGCEEVNQCYTPSTVTINVGDKVTWYNADTAAHTVTSGSNNSPSSLGAAFDSGLLLGGQTFTHVFKEAGTEDYLCIVHPWMTGSVIIKKSTSTPIIPKSTAPYGTDVVIPDGTSVPGCENTKSCYDPYQIRIGRGSTVTWYNADTAAHTVTSGSNSNPDSIGAAFDSGLFLSGSSYSVRLDKEGTYPYTCIIHPWMTGYVIVERGGSVAPPPTPIPTPRDTTPPKILKPTDIQVDADDPSGARVTFDVLAIDETDEIVRPSCSPSSGSFFAVGDTRVTCSAMDSSGNRAQQISFTVTVISPGIIIPNWVKNVAAFWCDDKIDDASFVDGVQYLIDNDIIVVSGSSSGYGDSQVIPSWIKNNACWWSQGLISDEDFASGLEYLISKGILRV